MHTFSAEVEQGFLISALILSTSLFHGLLSAMVFKVLFFLLVLLLFTMAPKCSAEVLFSVLCARSVWCAGKEKIHVK